MSSSNIILFVSHNKELIIVLRFLFPPKRWIPSLNQITTGTFQTIQEAYDLTTSVLDIVSDFMVFCFNEDTDWLILKIQIVGFCFPTKWYFLSSGHHFRIHLLKVTMKLKYMFIPGCYILWWPGALFVTVHYPSTGAWYRLLLHIIYWAQFCQSLS